MEAIWDEALRYNYDLNTDSVVFDVGGFEGDFAHNIFSKYSCNVLVFEPVKQFYEIIKNRFSGNDKIKVYNYGLGSKEETICMGVTGSSSSIFNKTHDNNQYIEIKDVLPVLCEVSIVDLIKINIEGAEYDLLDYIIEKGLQAKLKNVQVQFHMNITDYSYRRQRIREALSKTHHLTYDFPYTHENWQLN